MAAAIISLGTTAYAFHSGGVAECMGCHNIHDALSTDDLLAGTDISSTCLNCHAAAGAGSYHIATPDSSLGAGQAPYQRTPGGDFGWLKKTYTYTPHGTTETELGEHHGHSIVATDFLYEADSENTTAPGGGASAMLGADLSCNSCHDNHGKLRRDSAGNFSTGGAPIIASGSYSNSPVPGANQAVGAYRLLRGTGSTAGSGGKTFTAIFNAVTPSTYNVSNSKGGVRVAYGQGISEWCGTCHEEMYSITSTKHTHPVSQTLSGGISDIYNSYVGSGNMTGSSATSYDPIIPFQTDNVTAFTTLAGQVALTTGPASSDRVMCLSCHRAHASGWPHMVRYSYEAEMSVVEGQWPGSDASGDASAVKWAMGRTTAETSAAYNDKSASNYAAYQRVLCNKCHAKD